jgi:hypothetical protein
MGPKEDGSLDSLMMAEDVYTSRDVGIGNIYHSSLKTPFWSQTAICDDLCFIIMVASHLSISDKMQIFVIDVSLFCDD